MTNILSFAVANPQSDCPVPGIKRTSIFAAEISFTRLSSRVSCG
jgi:hypothetical protein